MKGLAIAIVGLLISISYLVVQTNKSNDSSHSPQQHSGHEKPNAPPTIPAQASTQTANNPPTNPAPKEKPQRDWVDYVTLGLTAVLAGTAIFGTCYALQTLKAIQHEARIATAALKESNKLARAAKTSADVLTVAANAAGQSSEFAKKTTKDSERADILIESISIETGNQNWTQNGDGKLVVHFRNFGRTRATEVRLRVELVVPSVNLTRGKYDLPSMVLGKGQKQTVTTDTFHDCLGLPLFNQVIKGQKEMHFHASVVYEDVFGDSYTTKDIGVFDVRTSSFKIIQKTAG